MKEVENGNRSLRESWRKVRHAFDRAVGQSPNQQEAFLQRLATSEPAIAEEVRELLELSKPTIGPPTGTGRSGGHPEGKGPPSTDGTHTPSSTDGSSPLSDPDPLANVINAVASDFADSDSNQLTFDSVLGENRIAAYVIERELGRGGMGTVFLARRADTAYQQMVAIKVVSRLSGSEAALRFQVERQILADLDHPNIARLLDGGTTQGGHQFLVMEYIDGEQILVYCRAQNLTFRGRLDLFLSVCSAVDHAHRRLVVHRDLKPSNILVDENGRAKLLDFGIAKLLNPEALPIAVAHTRTMHRLMTPEYASPEQVIGGTVTTATDVYALGLLLFEMVTEQKAQRFDSSSLTEIESVVCEGTPKSISKTISSAGNAKLPTALGAIDTYVDDLDLIVQKALEKEPERRYPSARELAADVQRLLRGAPIEARTPSVFYLARSFAKRHRFGVAAAFITLLALTSFSVVVSGLSLRLREQRDRAVEQAQRAEAATSFLTEAFSSPDPGRARGEEITALEMLEAGAAKIDANLTKEAPEIAVELRQRLSSVFEGLGFNQQAERELRIALPVAEGVGDDGLIGGVLNQLGDLLRTRSQPAEAEPLLERALFLRRSTFGQQSRQVAETLNNLGLVYRSADRLDQANESLSEALELRQLFADQDPAGLAVTLRNLALVAEDRSDYRQALDLHQRALDLQLKIHGEDHPSTLNAMVSLGATYADLGEFELAERSLANGRALAERIFGRKHHRYGSVLNEIANVWHDLGRYDLAEEAYLEAIDVYRELDDPRMTAILINNYASLLEERGDPEQAESMFRQSLEARLELFDEKSSSVGRARNNLGRVLLTLGKIEEAQAELEQAKSIYATTLGVSHTAYAGTLRLLAKVATEEGDLDKALKNLDQALVIYGSTQPGHPREAAAQLDRSKVLRALGEPKSALVEATRALANLTERLPGDHVLIGLAHCEVAAGLNALGQRAAAAQEATSGANILLNQYGANSSQSAECQALKG